jgi:hypothetical protein
VIPLSGFRFRPGGSPTSIYEYLLIGLARP